MAQHNTSNKGPFLWFIGPVAVFLTILMWQAGVSTPHPHEVLEGANTSPKKEMIQHETPHSNAADTVHHEMKPDSSHMSHPAEPAHSGEHH
jgi:hypothetical protein